MKRENMTDKEVAEVLGLAVSSLRKWRWLGIGPPTRKFGRALRYNRVELEDWISSRPAGGDSKKGAS